MSIMDFFRGAPATTQQPAAPAPAATQAPVQGTQPAAAPEAPAAPANPLDEFKNLWEAPKEGDPTPPNFDPTKLFQIDPAKIQAAVGQMDFTQSVTPDLLQQVTAGGEGAVQALAKVMNTVAQTAFAQSMLGASKLVETAMVKANDSLDARMKEGIRQQQISTQIRETNPALNHPAAQPLVAALEAQFTQKYPTASPTEITKMAQDYLVKFASVANPSSPSQQQTTPPGEDWEKFFMS